MESLIHPSFGSGTDNPNFKTYYYLINGKLFSYLNEVPYKVKEQSIKGLDELNERWYKIYYNEWEEKLVEIEISDSELEKVKNKVYDFENCAFDSPPINVTDLIDSTYDKEHGIDIYFFKEPIEKCDCGFMADEKGICTDCNLPKPLRNIEQVECCKRNEKGVKMCTLKCCSKLENTKLSKKEKIIKWIAQRIKDEQRKHSSNDENWHEIAARKIYVSYNITLKND